ncbi:MAG: cytochrome P450, partial [Pseudomonadota bacterium]
TEQIPMPKLYPVLQNLPAFDVVAPVQSLNRLADELGPIYRLKLPVLDSVVISSPALVAEIHDDKRFPKRVHGPLPYLREFVGNGLFTAESHSLEWERGHRVLHNGFSPKLVARYHASMVDIVEQMLLRWERHGAQHDIDVSLDMTKVTLDVVALCCFGHRFNNFYRNDAHPFLEALSFCLREANERPKRLPGASLFLRNTQKRYRKEVEAMHSLVRSIIEQRRAGEARPGTDVLEQLLASEGLEHPLSDQEVLDQIMTFLIAGHETTSGALAFALYEITNAPHVAQALQEELTQTLGDDPSALPSFECLQKMKYLEAVVNETLRLWPTLPVYGVQSDEPIELQERWRIEPQQELIVLLPALHRSPECWGSDGDAFRPERFLQLSPRDYQYAFQPWGRGRRSCLGRFFALHEIKLVLASVFQRFDVSVAPAAGAMSVVETLSFKPKDLHMRVRAKGA